MEIDKQDTVIVYSPQSRRVTRDGVTADVSIIPLGYESEWPLEVINAANTSTVWDDLFPTDVAACAEFERTLAEEGMGAFRDCATVIPFRR